MNPEGPPRVGFGVLKRALIGGVLIVLLSAGAVASAALLQVQDVVDIVKRQGRAPIAIPEIDREDAGRPQTIMVLGSDRRFGDVKKRGNSDTIILIRLNKDARAISVMSIPRDLKVTIPGNDVPTKINAAFEQGGARLTLRTVKSVLSTPRRDFRINHVVEINFNSFQRAINYVGCVYADIDQRYYNDNSRGENYATIDIKPGYQRICGSDALDYVRFRHTDNDLVRAARQQDFLRQIKNQRGVQKLKDPRRIKTLARVFGRYFESDAGLRKKQELFGLAKLAIFSSAKPVHEVPFRISGSENDSAYLLANRAALDKTVTDFMRAGASVEQPSARPAATARPSRPRGRSRRPRAFPAPSAIRGLANVRRQGEDRGVLARPRLSFPFYFPAYARADGAYTDPEARVYSIRDEVGKLHRAYRMTMEIQAAGYGEFYGIQGTEWRDPPLLDSPDEVRTVRGRELALYRDGKHLRLVAWRSSRGVYWVTNTLLRKLSNKQMIGIASSFERLGAR